MTDEVKLLPCLKAFVEWAIQTGPWDGHDLDGGSIQEKAVELGILVQTKYDPAIHGENADADVGDPWFVWSDLWNTRPQPAPPEGEPDWFALAKELNELWNHPASSRTMTGAVADELRKAYRLGLAARPKVEDAEVARVVANMRGRLGAMSQQPDKECNEAASLLERLAGDLQNWWSAAIVAMKAQEAAEAKLAEREAELVKADAVIKQSYRSASEEGLPHADYLKYTDEALERHAARQQQKDSDESSRG